jgi:hypothetical protein
MYLVDNFHSDTPLRIYVITPEGFEIPWQFLHPTGDISKDKFWGFRYELTVIPMQHSSDNVGNPFLDSDGGEVVFAQYRGSSEEIDISVAKKAKEFGESLQSLLKQGSGYKPASSKQELINTFSQAREKTWLIAAYTHATAGVTAVKGEGNEYGITSDGAGVRLRFTPDESFFSSDIEDLYNALEQNPDGSLPTYFPRRPLAFLDGCETGSSIETVIKDQDVAGTASIFNTNGKSLGFPTELMNAGARGVLVTESKVPVNFASSFGQALLKQLFSGGQVASSLLEVRLRFRDKARNPMGLVFSYYGNPDLRIAANHPDALSKKN